LTPVPPRPGPGAGAARLSQMLRVDHAGELGAVHIYRAQAAVFGGSVRTEAMAARMARHEAQEQVHLDRFNALLTDTRTRPTLMTPIWRAAAYALGVGTALMGEKAAHACTEAVESVIEDHYAAQIAELADREPELAAELVAFRAEEIDHKDEAVAEGAREAPGYPVLTALIRAGCKAAIKISEVV
jgi:3-demethoxyubiquinol 3-hydroxylase